MMLVSMVVQCLLVLGSEVLVDAEVHVVVILELTKIGC